MSTPSSSRRSSLRLHNQEKHQQDESGDEKMMAIDKMETSRNSSTKRTPKQQEPKTDSNPNTPLLKTTPVDKDIQKAEYLQLVGMVRNSYAILIGKSDEDKNRVWQDIFNKCMDLNHTWAQGKDMTYLRRSKWPNLKRDALKRHIRGKKAGREVTTEVDKVVLSFTMPESHPLNTSQGGASNSDAGNETSMDFSGKLDGSSFALSNGKSPYLGSVAGKSPYGGGVRTRSAQNEEQQQNSSSLPHLFANDPVDFTPPESRQSQSTTADSANSNYNFGTALPGATSLKRRAPGSSNAASLNNTGMKMKHEISGGSGSEEEKLSQLEKQLMEAKMRLYDVRARASEEEATVNRLEKAVLEEMMKMGKMPKISA